MHHMPCIPFTAARRWGSPSSQVPVVRFMHGREVPMGPATFSAELAGVGSCMRTQIPLKLAWAITIHKCQVRASLHACLCVHELLCCALHAVVITLRKAGSRLR